jgi:hypothetical protein
MSTAFSIPSDPDKADHLATELGELATATEWKRAALVYARVRVQDSAGRPPGKKVTDDLLSPAEYALRGIHGLRSKTTVRAYWRAWDNAITEGLAEPVSLGDEVELPDAEWADYYTPQNHTTPPYHRPDGQSVEDVLADSVVGESFTVVRDSGVSMRDRLGTGQCPPLASTLDDEEAPDIDDDAKLMVDDPCRFWDTQNIEDYIDNVAYIGVCSGEFVNRSIDTETPLLAADLPEILWGSWNTGEYNDCEVAAELADRLTAVLPRIEELRDLLRARADHELGRVVGMVNLVRSGDEEATERGRVQGISQQAADEEKSMWRS